MCIRDSHYLTWQQVDPVAFLQALRASPHKVWWTAWGARAGMLAGAMGSLFVIAHFTGADWEPMIGTALIVSLAVQTLCGFLIILLGQAQFWMLYAYAPLLVGIAFLCGLGTHFDFWRWLGLQIGLPFYVGRLVAHAGAVWVFQKHEALRSEHDRMRSGGITARLPELSWQSRVRTMRLFATALLSFVILYLYLALPVQGRSAWSLSDTAMRAIYMLLSIVAGAAGSLGLDATALAVEFAAPPGRFTAQHHWRTTYIGRAALFLPARCLHFTFASTVPAMAQGAAILTLLRHTGLAPVVRRAYRQISPSHRHQLLICLSLQPGGADAIQYLLPTLDASLRSMGECYAALAIEAARPTDLQRWIHVLETCPSSVVVGPELEAFPLYVLRAAHDALLSFKNSAEVSSVLDSLQTLRDNVHTADGCDAAMPDGAWPAALWLHLKQHQERLLTG